MSKEKKEKKCIYIYGLRDSLSPIPLCATIRPENGVSQNRQFSRVWLNKWRITPEIPEAVKAK